MGLTWSIAKIVSHLIEENGAWAAIQDFVPVFVASGAVKLVVTWLTDWAGVKASSTVKFQLRQKVLHALGKRPGSSSTMSVGETSALLLDGLDALDGYFGKYLPQLVQVAITTPALVLLFWTADPISALVLTVTIPLVPVFMILVGLITRDVQQRQLDTLWRLSNHFIEVIRGLATIKLFRREGFALENMSLVGEQYRKRTLSVLRVSFISGFSLELLASLSVAIIAVSIGLRLIDGTLSFFIGLFLLLLAPEVYLPLRQVGASYHAAASGISASERILGLLDQARVEPTTLINSAPGLTLICGPSGSGKSRAIVATLDSKPEAFAWMPQRIALMPGTLLSNIVGHSTYDSTLLASAVEMAQLDDVNLSDAIDDSGQGLSGGQMQRVMLARAFYRCLGNPKVALLLDEPTTSIDYKRAQKIRLQLHGLSEAGRSVIVASHEPVYRELASTVIEVGL